MKLVRWGGKGNEKPGLVDAAGRVRDLSAHLRDVDGAALAPARLAALAALDANALPLAPEGVRLGPCLAAPGKIICIGLNYKDHAAEANMALPPEPMMFLKPLSTLNGPYDTVAIPRGSTKTDYECELALVIGTRAAYVGEAEAMAHIAGYCVMNDVSERDFQLHRGGTTSKGKSCDGFAPLGPWLVTAEEVGDPGALGVRTFVNGRQRQNGHTRELIFGVAHLVSHLSHFMGLDPGDVISTGTPAGVALGIKDGSAYLRAGDVVECEIDKLGRQRITMVAG